MGWEPRIGRLDPLLGVSSPEVQLSAGVVISYEGQGSLLS